MPHDLVCASSSISLSTFTLSLLSTLQHGTPLFNNFVTAQRGDSLACKVFLPAESARWLLEHETIGLTNDLFRKISV